MFVVRSVFYRSALIFVVFLIRAVL